MEAIDAAAQAPKAEAHSPPGLKMKQESPSLTTDLGDTPQFPLKRPRDSSADDLEAESKRLKMSDDAAPQMEAEVQAEAQVEAQMQAEVQAEAQVQVEAHVQAEPEAGEPSLDLDFDMDSMIQNVMMGLGKINDMDAGQDVDMAADPLSSVTQDHPSSTHSQTPVPSMHMTSMKRPITSCLSLLALQLLVIISQHQFDAYNQTQNMDSETARFFAQLKSAFEQTRALYSTTDLILDPAALDLTMPENVTDIQVANLATFCFALFSFDGHQVYTREQLSALENQFFTVFLPNNSPITKSVSELFVAVKTHFVIDAMMIPHQSGTAEGQEAPQLDKIIADDFSIDVEDKLRARHGGSALTADEEALVTDLQRRKTALCDHIKNLPDTVLLKIAFPDEDLFRCLGEYLRDKLASLSGLASKHGIELPCAFSRTYANRHRSSFRDSSSNYSSSSSSSSSPSSSSHPSSSPKSPSSSATSSSCESSFCSCSCSSPDSGLGSGSGSDCKSGSNSDTCFRSRSPAATTNGTTQPQPTEDILALVAQSTQEYVRNTLSNMSPAPYQPTVPTPTGSGPPPQTQYLSHLHQTQAASPYYGYPQPVEQPPPPPVHESSEDLPPSQSLPSAVLYDRARQAALSKSNNQQRREGTTSTRRPWTQEEEKALMTGLDLVRGPHWSQILTLFGAEGTYSTILKDRTQVQLKDKARNLKLFFLKTNSEMPYYLQAVTGELKTRAPTQAARKEAEERARMNSEEEQARVQGIMTLSGLQHPQQNRGSAPATAPSTPLQSAAHMPHHLAHATTPTHGHGGVSGPPGTPVNVTPTHHRVPASSPYAATAAQLSQTPHGLSHGQPQTPTNSHAQRPSQPGTPQPQQHHQLQHHQHQQHQQQQEQQQQQQHQHQQQHQQQQQQQHHHQPDGHPATSQPQPQQQPQHQPDGLPATSQPADSVTQYAHDVAPVYNQEHEDRKDAELLLKLEAYTDGVLS
ncbi:Telomeric DNA-binding factor trf1 [Colletotrichum orbiculare MAFF 240422]|uniref:Telomeric DNA-binding factor trf1 n=1 Tax=Colletotrichum orbiculare (strain 104-T / ATCC 96160 / CBS 514.97 / LARS 414 / MAFF 240422) TaxID=1213857 RepID=A0A484G0T2_COLOR|nr:Telomeric DNA-binding factor trf1 [Colletotrichum orbiculare MAFF 240422]